LKNPAAEAKNKGNKKGNNLIFTADWRQECGMRK
jgi:hypothetical protein